MNNKSNIQAVIFKKGKYVFQNTFYKATQMRDIIQVHINMKY